MPPALELVAHGHDSVSAAIERRWHREGRGMRRLHRARVEADAETRRAAAAPPARAVRRTDAATAQRLRDWSSRRLAVLDNHLHHSQARRIAAMQRVEGPGSPMHSPMYSPMHSPMHSPKRAGAPRAVSTARPPVLPPLAAQPKAATSPSLR
jgi:hypothetical protein